MLGQVRRHPVVSYFLLAFALTWVPILIIVLPTGIPGEGDVLASRYIGVFAAMAAGPPVAGLALTITLEGRAGLAQLARHLLAWRASPVAYLAATLVVPMTALLVLLSLSALSTDFTPGVFTPTGGWPLLVLGLVYGLVAGTFEEIGWTGYVLRHLRISRSVITSGIGLGLLHGLWHGLAGYWGEGAVYGAWYLPYFIACWLLGLAGLRVLIVWLFRATGSLPLAQLAHASYTGGLLILWPPNASPLQNLIWTSGFAVLLLAVVSMLAALTPAAHQSRHSRLTDLRRS